MTRETKIGLLVGLAFVIVIGILFCDTYRGAQEPLPAPLTTAGNDVREGVNSPGLNSQPAVHFVTPSDVEPRTPVATRDEVTPPLSPVSIDRNYTPPAQNNSSNAPAVSTAQATAPQASNVPPALAKAAAQQGETLVAVNGNGSSNTPNASQSNTSPTDAGQANSAQPNGNTSDADQGDDTPKTAPAVPAGLRQYKAQGGDTVSRMAARFLGVNNKANRAAIINANPSLKANPNKVIVGVTYLIPVASHPAAAAPSQGSDGSASGASASNGSDSQSPRSTSGSPSDASLDNSKSTALPPPSAAGYWYTVKAGDSLWKIANNELGDPGAVDAIEELNHTTLKGDDHDVVTVGMKLRLPAKPVASAAD